MTRLQEAQVLARRIQYGGRKGRRAYRRLLGFWCSELEDAGITLDLVPKGITSYGRKLRLLEVT